MLGKLAVAAGFAAGYVLGTKAGRQRYEEIVAQARKVAGNETVQSTAGALQAKGADLVDKAKHSDLVEKAMQSDVATKVKSTVSKDTPAYETTPTSSYEPTTSGSAASGSAASGSAANGPTSSGPVVNGTKDV